MSYKPVTIMSGSPVTDEMIADMKNKWTPVSLALGVTKCEAIQTGSVSNFVIATYPDKATSDVAAKIAPAMRSEAQKGI